MAQTRRKWTDAQKQRILAVAKAKGVANAAKQFKVTESSVYKWRKDADAAALANAPRKNRPRKQRRQGTSVAVSRPPQEIAVVKLEAENEVLRNLVVDQLLELRKLRA